MSKLKAILRNQLYMPLAEKLSGRRIREKITRLEQWRHESSAEKALRIANALGDTLQYAGNNVPYYRDLFRRIKFDPECVRKDIAWLNDLPHLTKEIVMMQPERFISDAFDRNTLIERKTSGSTGLTLSFFYSQAELDLASAVLRFLDLAAGKTPDDSEVYLRLIPLGGAAMSLRERILETFKEVVLNRSTVEITSLDTDQARRCLQTVRRQHPYSVYGLRSTLESIVRLADDSALCRNLSRIYISTGETLDRRAADFITSNIGCKIFNRYGNAEFGAVAQSETDSQTLRFMDGLVLPENFIVEGFSEIVLTTLHSRAMPLIRYRTGDLGKVTADSNGSYYLTDVTGRLHDLIHIGSRSFTTAYLSEFLQKRFAVHDFQIVEELDATPLEFRVVTDHPEQLEQIASALHLHLGQEVKVVRIRLSDFMRRGRQMKFTHVIRSAAQ